MRPSGYGYIKTSMIELAASLGVEVSGHHFFGELGGGDDALFTALVVLGLLRRRGCTLAELVAPIGWPAITPDLRVSCSEEAPAMIETIAAACRVPVSRLDGVRADYGDGWALARISITEASITLRFEGPDRRRVREIVEDFLAAVPPLRCAALAQLDDWKE
jgi:phosphomannomutase/phosphoglucomutase